MSSARITSNFGFREGVPAAAKRRRPRPLPERLCGSSCLLLYVPGTQIELDCLCPAQPRRLDLQLRVRRAETVEHQLLHRFHHLRMPSSDVGELAGVCPQVIQPPIASRRRIIGLVPVSPLPPAGTKDELPPGCPNECFLVLQVLAEDVVARHDLALLEVRPQA